MKIEIILGDITKLHVDAIVNAANCTLLGGGGVDGAIHRAAGPALYEECLKIGGGKTGEAYLTGAGKLPCRYVIHTPGPVWNGGKSQEEQLLSSCYANSLKRAAEKQCETIAFPCISTGIFGFPHEPAARICLDVLRNYREEFPKKAIVCCFLPEDKEIYDKLCQSDGHAPA